MNTVLTGARDSDGMVRASSMSNLGEICKLLHFSLGNIVQEVSLLNEHSTDWSQRRRWYGESQHYVKFWRDR